MTTITLDALGVGQWGQVAEVATEPVMRRRLLDLGLVPGTTVSCTAVSPAGDPAGQCAFTLAGGSTRCCRAHGFQGRDRQSSPSWHIRRR